MFINCNKTKCMTVGTKQTLAFQNEELSLTINSEQLQHSACEKLLGIKIDSNLNTAPVYLKNKIQYLSDRNPYSLRKVVSETLQIPKAKTEFF